MILLPEGRNIGDLAPLMQAAERAGLIRIIGLVFVTKDREGEVWTVGAQDLDSEAADMYGSCSNRIQGWPSADDLETIGAMLPADSQAAAFLIESTWAGRLEEASSY